MLDSFLALLRGEKIDEVVWTGDISYWIDGQKEHKTASPDWDTEEGYLKLHRDLGLMPYIYYDKFWAGEPRYDDAVEVVVEKNGCLTTRTFHTPKGELREETLYSPASCSTAVTRYPVQSKADLEVLLCLLEHRRLEPAHLDDYARRAAWWRQYDGLPCIGLPRSPLSSLCYEWAGVQNAVFLLTDYEDLVRQIVACMEDQEEPILRAICDLRPPLVHFPDNLSSANLTSLYDPFMAAGHRRRLDTLHAAGVKAAVHLDGTVRGLLPKLIDSGFDAIEALTPQPGGDLSVAEIRQLAGDRRVILWGGVPGVLFARPFTWEQVRDHVLRVVECWGVGPFVLGIADQVPPDGDVEHCRRIAELLRRL